MKTSLDGMTGEKWKVLTEAQRIELRDLSNLSPQLTQWEGWRVEVTDEGGDEGEARRFNVGRSTGWRPCHLEIYNTRCIGGYAARKQYKSVKPIRRVR